jgi:hypothetical protein
MLPFNDRQNPLLIANSEIAAGYPVLQFQRQGVATFSTLRPGGTPEAETPTVFLRLYCAADPGVGEGEVEVQWLVRWRWVRAIGPVITRPPFNEPDGIRQEDLDGTDATALLPVEEGEGFIEETLTTRLFGDGRRSHLSVTAPLAMEPNNVPGDYLVVYLGLLDPEVDPVYLLMAELRW